MRARTLLALSAALASGCASAGSEAPSSKLGLYGALRSFDSGDWGAVDDQGVIGLELVHEAPGSAVGFEIGAFGSSDEEDVSDVLGADPNARGRTAEVAVGLHKTFETDYAGVHPYLGGGLSWLWAELRREIAATELEDDDGSIGGYFHVGVDFEVTPILLLGLDLRGRAGTEPEMFGEDFTANYGQVAVVLSLRF